MRKILLGMICLCLCLLLYLPVNASEKQIEINITEQYSNCTFWIESQNENEWQVSIFDPDGNIYDCQYDESTNSYYCDFKALYEGTYYVNIVSSQEIANTKVVIKSTVQNTSDFDASGVVIAKAVAGLQIYIKDSSVIVEWTDDTCGNLCIKVFDTDTFMVLADEKTNSKYFECPFSDTVSKVTVSVVPASSQDVDAAVHTVTLDANYKPKGNVIFDESSACTKSSQYTCDVQLDDFQEIGVEVNDKIVFPFQAFNKGNQAISFELNEGINDIKVFIRDDNGSMKSFQTQVVCDTVLPQLKLAQEYDGVVINETTILLEGTVSDFKTLYVNDVELNVSDNGYFKCECGLIDGPNSITIVAVDEAGNEISYDAVITKGKPSSVRTLISNVITIVLYAGIIFLGVKFGPKLLDKVFKKKGNTKNEDEKERK